MVCDDGQTFGEEMKTHPVTGSAHESSGAAKNRIEVHESAQKAKAAADVETLFTAYEAAVKDRVEMEESLMTLARMAVDKKPEGDRTIDAVHAMKEVALAAINLAREFAPKN